MINILDPSQCCGCTACASICAHDAITMQPDVLGFLYPKVDKSKCVECGLCEKVCAFNENYDRSLNLPKPTAYGARHKDMNEVATSRSGAAFIAISDHILENGGVVYGAGYTDHFRVVHKRAETKEQRNEFKGSKYVQSDLTGIFQQVKQDLRNGRTVLFSGTPCQTAGLQSYVGNKLREDLVLMDIVCHGVPSPYLWRDYLAYLEKKHGSEIYYVNFRDKDEFGWSAHQESFKFIKTPNIKSIFPFNFYQPTWFRHSCGVCKYTNLHRPSDITIGDFWGWQKTDSSINTDDKGLSLILCNTEKGQKLFDIIAEQMIVIPAKLENCLQPNLQYPSNIPQIRMGFEDDYAHYGFKKVMSKYGYLGWGYKKKTYWIRIKVIVKRILGKL